MRAAKKDKLRKNLSPQVTSCWLALHAVLAVGLSFVVTDCCVTGACCAALLTFMRTQWRSRSLKSLAVSRQQTGHSILPVVLQALRKAGGEGHWSWQQDPKQQSNDVVGNDADSLALHHGSGRPVWPAPDQDRDYSCYPPGEAIMPLAPNWGATLLVPYAMLAC